MRKIVRLFRRHVDFDGIADDDVYFGRVRDGLEDDFGSICAELLPSDGIALDIGANIGVTVLDPESSA